MARPISPFHKPSTIQGSVTVNRARSTRSTASRPSLPRWWAMGRAMTATVIPTNAAKKGTAAAEAAGATGVAPG